MKIKGIAIIGTLFITSVMNAQNRGESNVNVQQSQVFILQNNQSLSNVQYNFNANVNVNQVSNLNVNPSRNTNISNVRSNKGAVALGNVYDNEQAPVQNISRGGNNRANESEVEPIVQRSAPNINVPNVDVNLTVNKPVEVVKEEKEVREVKEVNLPKVNFTSKGIEDYIIKFSGGSSSSTTSKKVKGNKYMYHQKAGVKSFSKFNFKKFFKKTFSVKKKKTICSVVCYKF